MIAQYIQLQPVEATSRPLAYGILGKHDNESVTNPGEHKPRRPSDPAIFLPRRLRRPGDSLAPTNSRRQVQFSFVADPFRQHPSSSQPWIRLRQSRKPQSRVATECSSYFDVPRAPQVYAPVNDPLSWHVSSIGTLLQTLPHCRQSPRHRGSLFLRRSLHPKLNCSTYTEDLVPCCLLTSGPSAAGGGAARCSCELTASHIQEGAHRTIAPARLIHHSAGEFDVDPVWQAKSTTV